MYQETGSLDSASSHEGSPSSNIIHDEEHINECRQDLDNTINTCSQECCTGFG